MKTFVPLIRKNYDSHEYFLDGWTNVSYELCFDWASKNHMEEYIKPSILHLSSFYLNKITDSVNTGKYLLENYSSLKAR